MQRAEDFPGSLERDPVCGRELAREQASLSAELKGRTYLFCSERGRMLFAIRPAWLVQHCGAREIRRAS